MRGSDLLPINSMMRAGLGPCRGDALVRAVKLNGLGGRVDVRTETDDEGGEMMQDRRRRRSSSSPTVNRRRRQPRQRKC